MDADVVCEVNYADVPVYKFRKAELPQEQMQEWVKYFAGENKLYSWPTIYTKKYYQERIIEAQRGSDVDGELVVNEEYIEELKRRYAEAPEGNEKQYIDAEYDYVNGNSDTGKICLSAAIEAEGDDASVYAKTRIPGGENGFSEFKYSKGMQVISEISIFDILNDPEVEYGGYDEDMEKIEIGTITEEEARPKADQLLADLGITDMKLVKSGRACLESFDNQFGIDSDRPDVGGRELLYMRNISGITVDPDIADVLNSTQILDENGVSLTAPSIWTEKINVFVSNDGEIEAFEYNAMLEEGELLSEAVTLKPFEEIVEKAADQLYYKNSFLQEGWTSEIEIDSVSLVMTYSAAENDFDSILLIPAWKFGGTQFITAPNGETSEEYIFATINAIDGSRA